MGEKRQTSHVEEFLITYVDTPRSKRGHNGTPSPKSGVHLFLLKRTVERGGGGGNCAEKEHDKHRSQIKVKVDRHTSH